MSCPKCGSGNIAKEKTMRGWSGDYVCCDCGYVENWIENQHELGEIKKVFG